MFTKQKFLNLPQEQQHKKCAELLRLYYDQKQPQIKEEYNTIQSWLTLDALKTGTNEEISDRFHWHLNKANQHLREHNLLTQIEKGDRNSAKTP